MTSTALALIPLAQQTNLDSIGARLSGLAGQAAGALAAIAVASALVMMYWRLLVSCFEAPSPGKVLSAAVVPLVMIFFVGAAPDLMDLAYVLGQDLLTGTP